MNPADITDLSDWPEDDPTPVADGLTDDLDRPIPLWPTDR